MKKKIWIPKQPTQMIIYNTSSIDVQTNNKSYYNQSQITIPEITTIPIPTFKKLSNNYIKEDSLDDNTIENIPIPKFKNDNNNIEKLLILHEIDDKKLVDLVKNFIKSYKNHIHENNIDRNISINLQYWYNYNKKCFIKLIKYIDNNKLNKDNIKKIILSALRTEPMIYNK